MSTFWIFSLGFFAQFLFGLRLIIQWWLSERKKMVVSPVIFWILSLSASTLMLIYGLLREDVIIIFGQLISYAIYIRNLQLNKAWYKFSQPVKILIISVPVLIVMFTFGTNGFIYTPADLFQDMSIFFYLGGLGQFLLNARFFYQLYYSEKRNESVLPVGFWWISMAGSIFMLLYGVFRQDPVLLVSHSLTLLPYVRNIMLGIRSSKIIPG